MENDTQDRKLYGLVGRNINYSLSPAMHNAAFKHFGISAEYRLFDTAEEDLEAFLSENVFSGRLSGFNVTVPYKIRVRQLLEKCSLLEVETTDWVDIIGSVNTVKVDGRKVLLDNTDAYGFYQSLRDEAKLTLAGKQVFVAGAGGAGRVLALYMATLRKDLPLSVKVYDVDRDKLAELEEIYSKQLSSGGTISALEAASSPLEAKGCDLVVNATPLGMKETDPLPVPSEVLEEGMTVYDLVYAHETPLVRAAREKGLTALNGLGMLVGQGAFAFCIWTGTPASEGRPVMERAALRELEAIR
ncbi:MAG: hypothetical protein GF409_00835 [Candidatus Omnitrophica bacterium]|nr:hypothetical protein [Candidatus Omnitrophota bacterium]